MVYSKIRSNDSFTYIVPFIDFGLQSTLTFIQKNIQNKESNEIQNQSLESHFTHYFTLTKCTDVRSSALRPLNPVRKP